MTAVAACRMPEGSASQQEKGNGMGPVMKGWDARLRMRFDLLASLDLGWVGGSWEASNT